MVLVDGVGLHQGDDDESAAVGQCADLERHPREGEQPAAGRGREGQRERPRALLPGFRRLAGFQRRELLLAIGCLIDVLALDILYGVLVAVGLSVAELLSRVARPHDAVEGLVPGLAGMHDIEDCPQARTIPGLVVFANAEDFRTRALAAVADEPTPVRWFVLDTEANVEVDITALDSVEALRRELTARGIVFGLARVKQDLLDDLDAYGLTHDRGRR
ncbi:hypothetical protein KAURM247S_02339 [Kitasatospora aureofaciens]